MLRNFLSVVFSADQWKGVLAILRAICRWLWRVLCRRERPPRPRRGDCCIDLPPDVYKRADPLLYAQFYLMKMGLAVTWDNPDIELHIPNPAAPDGIGDPSSLLLPGHSYKVRVRVWNGSYDAPAVGLPVHLSYLSFGAGTKSNPIATQKIDLGVKGSAKHPAFAVFDWKTPPDAGHYCLQVRLEWPDDANPDNNLGQENVNVGALSSPAKFTFTLRNETSVRHRYVLEADTYRLPGRGPCEERQQRFKTRIEESRARWEIARGQQSYGAFPVPADWNVVIDPAELVIAANAEQEIHVSIEPKGPFTGEKSFNVHAFIIRDDGRRDLAGGVTLTAVKA